MRKFVVLVIVILTGGAILISCEASGPVRNKNDRPNGKQLATPFERTFTGKTLRLDYMHSGDATSEKFSVEAVRLEGAWPGSRTQLADPTGLGKYRFRVHDAETRGLLYSRGFASIYGEWETTAEARERWRSFHESLRFPEPRRPVRLIIDKRNDAGEFRQVFATDCNPKSRFVDRGTTTGDYRVWPVVESGRPAEKVDLLFLGDGYTRDQMSKWHKDARRLAEDLLASEPYRSRRDDFNIWAIDVPSDRPGVTNPRSGFWNRTPLGLSYNSLDSDRYMLSERNREIRDIAALAPYDAMILIANSRKYGGGGIFNLYSTAAADSAVADYLIVHEFGHAFAALGDEYYTSPVSYEDLTPPGVEPWEPNLTALLDPDALKWKDLVHPDTPLATPWDQTSYDTLAREYQARRKELRDAGAPEESLEQLFQELKETTTPMLRDEPYFGKVGAFEGGGYMAKGLYRPEVDCVMFTRNTNEYCRVCRRAVNRIIDLYTR